MEKEDLLLQGAIDTHAHGYPEFTLGLRPRVDDLDWARLAVEAGMRGFVIKSHIWPTTSTADTLRKLFPDLQVFGSIALNPPVGGLSPLAVEIAAQTGAKVVWMPTWSARSDPPRPSEYLNRMRPFLKTLDASLTTLEGGLTILAEDGGLKPVVSEILRVCQEYDLVLASGHLPIGASLVLSREAKRHGVKFVLTHPLSRSVNASLDDQCEIAANGGMIEHTFLGCLPMHGRLSPKNVLDAIQAVGPGHCIMASDAIEAWNPPAPELLQMFIGSLLRMGTKEDDIYLMTHDNPASLLGLPPYEEGGPRCA